MPLYFTFISFIVSILFGYKIGIKGVCLYTAINVLLALISSIFIYYEVVISNSPTNIQLFDWINADFLSIKWEFTFDALTASMLIVVTSISLCAHVYSIEYMNGDPHQVRFMSYLSLFTFFMLILVTAGNLLQLFVGWEGVGVCSYLLINFWYTRISANKSAIMAMLVNKVSDLAMLFGFTALIYTFKTLNFDILFSIVEIHANYYYYTLDINNLIWNNIINTLTIVTFMFIIGAVGKSAQMGLHMWLPEAMEGPTPVSSLIHAATMVTAGIFLIIRCSFFFEIIPIALLWIILIGSMTSFMASTIGVFQNDLKKIVAYSTCSQLGYMFLSCGMLAYSNSMFHLFNHAFFKALLFLTAGYIIHALSNEQDLRKMGGLVKLLPAAYVFIMIGSLSLAGFPFLSGFYSKEKILELFYYIYNINIDLYYYNIILFCNLLAYCAMIFTIFYSMKLIIYAFFKNYNGFLHTIIIYNKKNIQYKIHYSLYFILIPLTFLSIFSIISGYIFQDIMIGVNTNSWANAFVFSKNNNYIFYSNLDLLQHNYMLISNEFNIYIKYIPIVWVFYFLSLSTFLYSTANTYLFKLFAGWNTGMYLYHILTEKYIFFNRFIVEPISYKIFDFAYNTTYLLIDKGLIEIIGPYGLTRVFTNITTSINNYKLSYVINYVVYILIGTMIIIHIFI